MRGPRQRQEPRYQRFVGVELAAVLEEVHRAHGSKASIVSVDRVRRGGVGGFFAQETYEVLVDGSESPTPATPPPALSFDDLLARRLDDEDLRSLDDDPVGKGPASPEPGPEPEPSPTLFLKPDPELWLEPDPEPDPDPGPDLDLTGPEPAPAPVLAPSRLGSVDGWSVVGLDHRLVTTPPLVARVPDRSGPRSALEFWAGYDRARQEAELLATVPVAISAIVGPLPTVEPVVRRCQQRHWSGQCRVYVLTSGGSGEAWATSDLDRSPLAGVYPGWTVVEHRDELVAVVEQDRGEFPLLVIDVPPALPPWLRPLVDRLRAHGVGLVHYVLDGHPTDEDLATWHGEIGRPAVLDLVTPVAAERALELVERGEPLASIAGVSVTADLLLALRAEVARAR